ncbi:6454_t:CDS:2, partial [Acaulospora colombiana]
RSDESEDAETACQTPKKRRVANNQLLTPKTPTTAPSDRGFTSPVSEATSCYLTPKSTRTVDLLKKPSGSSPEIIGEAKSLFRLSTVPTKLVGRNSEREAITKFLRNNIIGGTPGSLYITGAPGTGKTALVNEVWNGMKNTIKNETKCSIEFIMINCMNVDDPKRIFAKLLENSGRNAVKNAEETASEIVDIVKDRITVAQSDSASSFMSSQDSDVSLIEDQAIELCARRVASSNGDCRKALDVFRKAMELVETEMENSELRTRYQRLCRKDNLIIPSVSSEFHILVERLDKTGLIKVRRYKSTATRIIQLLVEDHDFMVVAKDHPVLRSVKF